MLDVKGFVRDLIDLPTHTPCRSREGGIMSREGPQGPNKSTEVHRVIDGIEVVKFSSGRSENTKVV